VWSALALYVGAEPVIRFLGGSEFDSSVPVLQIQGVATAASFLFAVWASGLWAIGAQRSLVVASSIGVASVFVLTAILAPSHGAVGSAVAMTVSELLLAGTAGLLFMRRRDLRAKAGIVPKVGVALAAGLLISVLGLPPLVLVVLATLAYFAVLLVLRGIPPEIRHSLTHRSPS
jgi:O-antigen/teichoic acid export membrane protein